MVRLILSDMPANPPLPLVACSPILPDTPDSCLWRVGAQTRLILSGRRVTACWQVKACVVVCLIGLRNSPPMSADTPQEYCNIIGKCQRNTGHVDKTSRMQKQEVTEAIMLKSMTLLHLKPLPHKNQPISCIKFCVQWLAGGMLVGGTLYSNDD